NGGGPMTADSAAVWFFENSSSSIKRLDLVTDQVTTFAANVTTTEALESAGDYLYAAQGFGGGLGAIVRRYTKATGASTPVAGTGEVGYQDGSGTDAWFS